MVNSLNPDFKSEADVEAVVEMAMSAIPALSEKQAEVLSTILVELTPNVTPDIVKESVEIAAEVSKGNILTSFFFNFEIRYFIFTLKLCFVRVIFAYLTFRSFMSKNHATKMLI